MGSNPFESPCGVEALVVNSEITHVPLHHKRPSFALLVRASFANKQNRTAEGWGLGAQCLCVEPELSPCIHNKNHTNKVYLFLRRLKKIFPKIFLCFEKKQTSIT
jgi:hypothetical protein